MKITTLILLTALLQVSAASFGQKVTIVKNNIALSEVFKEIRKQTGYNVLWQPGQVNGTKTVNLHIKNQTLNNALDQILKDQKLEYNIEEETIMIKVKEPSFLDRVVSAFASIDVRGIVLDEAGNPLVGATVKVKEVNKSTKTNERGEFFLQGVEEKAVLVISYLGYESREVAVAKDLGSIKLSLADSKLEEVTINAGYYKVTDRERTGSISRITSKDIEKQPVNNVLAAMQANIPGVQITQNTGVPGGGFTIRVRGQNSISQGNNPFYIVDGVPFNAISTSSNNSTGITANSNPLASLNPNDIESVEVLKDADATAIYGSRGANGVILITTKRGKAGKNIATLSISQGVSRVAHMMDMMKTEEYLAMRREALKNDNLPVSTTDYDLNGTWDPNKYTNWQKELIGKGAPITNIQSSLMGGTNSITYLIGANYYKEGTVFPGDQSYTRASGNFSLLYLSLDKKLTASLDANYSQINSDLFTTEITRFISLAPNYPNLLDSKGLLNWENNTMYENPIAFTRQLYNAKTNNLVANAALTYALLRDLKLKASFGSTTTNRNEFDKSPLTTYAPVKNPDNTFRISDFCNNTSNNYTIDGQAEYIKQINNGKFSILVGATFQQGIIDLQKVTASGYSSDAVMENISAASTYKTFSSYTQYRYTAAFGRVNYSLKDKYFINATGRRDGSTRFGPAKQFANFGALGAAWILSKEKNIKNYLPFISFAKIRGSYGITGNDQIADYGYLELWINRNTYQGLTTISPGNIANPNYGWEVNKKAEIAIDLNFLDDRISVSTGYYSNRSSNQLVLNRITPSSGFATIQDNLPATVSNTGFEIELLTKNLYNKTWYWTTSINITIPKNKLLDYPNLATSSNSSVYALGEPLSIKKLYNTIVNDQTGLYTRQDANNNGVIDLADQNLVAFVGQKFYGGIQNSFSYKGVNLDFMFHFVKQTGTGFSQNFRVPGQFSVTNPFSNQLPRLSDHWIDPESNANYQKYSTMSSASTSFSNAWLAGNLTVYDASFIRLKNASLSYNFPSKWNQKLQINGMNIYLQGQNLLTITKFKGLDPENNTISNLPPLQTFIVGFRLTL